MKSAIGISAILLVMLSVTDCKSDKSKLLYESKDFSVYGNMVKQGDYKATATADNRLISDYQSPANAFFDPAVSFKISINGRDNEAPAGQDHQAYLIPGEDGKVIVRCVFGEKDPLPSIGKKNDMGTPANTPVRFEVDMTKVTSSFEREGFYSDFNGNKIFKSDFKGVWIAGGTTPLSWDFENLQGRDDLRLTDSDGDGIYSCDLFFNIYDPSKQKASEKTLLKDISQYPALKTPFTLMNALYRLSIEEMMLDIRPDSAFMAGKEWNGVWTRDISYSIILSLAAIEPHVASNSLMHKVKDGLIIQDTGTGGSWPVSTDRQIWSLAAWEIFKSTGDTVWLRQAYDIICNSVNRDLKVAFNSETGLFYGESSFLDWRKQTYPLWMEPVDIYRSHNLGTNAVFYGTLIVLDKMGDILGADNDYLKIADKLKESINAKLWIEGKGYYSQYLYGHYSYSLSPRSESLGEAMCILFDIAGENQKKQMFAAVPVLGFGIPCIYPQIPGIPPYHNNTVWPFVQAYWTWAGAKSHNAEVVEHGLASVYRQAALFLTNKENMVAENGDYNGTQVNSDYQLWSVAGNLAMIYRVIFGMQYEADGLSFYPLIPRSYKGEFQLMNFKYRKAILDIKIEKYGDDIALLELDGNEITGHMIPGSLEGQHTVRIVMNGKQDDSLFNLVTNIVSPDTPVPSIASGELSWLPVEGASAYRVFLNSKQVAETHDCIYNLPAKSSGEYQVMSVADEGAGSFLSRPLTWRVYNNSKTAEAEQFAKQSTGDVFGFTGKGFIELRKGDSPFSFKLKAEAGGDYVIEFRYSNGNGPVNTDNKCAQRSLFINDNYAGTVILPQRGRGEWSDWGLSNPLTVRLEQGSNDLELRFMDYNNNMNVEENSFLLDNIRFFPADAVR